LVQDRHHQVEHDHVWPPADSELERLGAVAGGLERVTRLVA
jgi:hypothetical protein